MIQYKWVILRKFDYSTNDLNKIISFINWKREAKIVIDEEKKDQYSVCLNGAIALPNPSENDFIDYNNITDDILSNWLDNIYGSDYRNDDLKIMLEEEMNNEKYIK